MIRPAFLATLLVAAPALAQQATYDPMPQPAQPQQPAPMQMVQPLDDLSLARAAAARGDAAEALSRYLRILSTHPDDVVALTGAGQSALAVGDLGSAGGFFGRAEARAPGDGAIKAGIGAVLVRQGDARGALRYFAAAARLGVPEARFAADRGLAYDLRGEPHRAQADYQLALVQQPGDADVIKHLALSQALAGDQATALATLDPLLRKQDLSAWRTRMFARAVGGDVAGATNDAGLILNAAQAAAIAPYLEKLAALKPAEKAAAVFLGRMPSAHPATVASAAPLMPTRGAAPASSQTSDVTMPLPPPGGSAATLTPPLVTPTPAQPAPQPYATVERPLTRRERLAEERRAAAEARKAAAEEALASRPTRYWAQVAGGANKRDLPRAWTALQAKWGSKLGGYSPATMHYRYTNRLLVGPFANASAAQDWVDARRAEGLASFMVTTPAGTPVESLDGRELNGEPAARGRHGKATRGHSGGGTVTHGRSHGARSGGGHKASGHASSGRSSSHKSSGHSSSHKRHR